MSIILLNKIKNSFTLKKVLLIIILSWVVFSVYYVFNAEWQKFRTEKIRGAYQQGVADTVRLIIKEADKCTPIPLIDEDKKVEIMSTACPR